MRKIAAILALCLGVSLLFSWIYMVRDDGKTAADRITQSFDSIGNNAALDRIAHEKENRDNEERIYALVGAAAVIAGFALWPRKAAIPATT